MGVSLLSMLAVHYILLAKSGLIFQRNKLQVLHLQLSVELSKQKLFRIVGFFVGKCSQGDKVRF